MKLRSIAIVCFAWALFADVSPPTNDMDPPGCGCGDDDARVQIQVCTSEVQCDGNQVCCRGTCQKTCEDRACVDGLDCPPGEVCSQGRCAPVPRGEDPPAPSE